MILRRQPPVYSVQTSCIDIFPPHSIALFYDRLQPSNMIPLICFPLLSYLIPPGTTNRHSSLTSSTVLFLKTLA